MELLKKIAAFIRDISAATFCCPDKLCDGAVSLDKPIVTESSWARHGSHYCNKYLIELAQEHQLPESKEVKVVAAFHRGWDDCVKHFIQTGLLNSLN